MADPANVRIVCKGWLMKRKHKTLSMSDKKRIFVLWSDGWLRYFSDDMTEHKKGEIYLKGTQIVGFDDGTIVGFVVHAEKDWDLVSLLDSHEQRRLDISEWLQNLSAVAEVTPLPLAPTPTTPRSRPSGSVCSTSTVATTAVGAGFRGWLLKKRKRALATTNKRMFVIDPAGLLLYFSDEDCTVLKGRIPLSSTTQLWSHVPGELMLINSGRVWNLASLKSSSEARGMDINNWLAALRPFVPPSSICSNVSAQSMLEWVNNCFSDEDDDDDPLLLSPRSARTSIPAAPSATAATTRPTATSMGSAPNVAARNQDDVMFDVAI